MSITTQSVRQNITWIKGDTFNPIMRFYSDEAKTAPIDLTGRTYRMQFRDREGTELLTAETGNGITIGGADNNELAFDFIMDVPVGTNLYDLEQTNNGVVTTIVGGFAIIKTEITE